MELEDCLILILGSVLRDEPIDTIECPYLHELGYERFHAQCKALLAVSFIGNVRVSIKKFVCELEIESLRHQVVQFRKCSKLIHIAARDEINFSKQRKSAKINASKWTYCHIIATGSDSPERAADLEPSKNQRTHR